MAMKDFFKKLLGQSNDAEVRRLQKIADSVLALEDKYKGLSDEELQKQTPLLKERLHNGETVDDILPARPSGKRYGGWTASACSPYRSWAASVCIRAASPR